MAERLRSRYPDRADSILTFTCDRMRRYEGAWHLEEKTFLPDSFVVKEEEPTFLDELPPQRKVIPLNREGQTFLQEFCGSDHHIALSKGRIRNGKTEVLSGPLCGQEHLISRIDRHKRLAQLNVPGMEPVGKLCVGLEIMEKN